MSEKREIEYEQVSVKVPKLVMDYLRHHILEVSSTW